MLFLLFVGFVALVGRAFYLMGGVSTGFLQRQGEARYARTLEIPATRGRITDRNGVVLASSVPARAVWAIPEDVDAGPEQLNTLARLLQMNVSELKRRLADDDRTFVYLRRQVDADVAERIAALKLAGIHSTREFKRHYPEGATNAHVIGFTNVEDRGQEGIELAHERLLAGRAGSRRVIKDRLGRVIEDDWLREPLDGKDLALSIDNRIQYIAHAALKGALDKHRAKAGAAIVFDVKTGEVLALANLPSFDPNLRGRLAGDAVRNRVLTDTFEPGSTMKPFSIAAALEAGKVKVDTRIQTAPGRLTIGNRTIGDAHAHGMLTVEEIVSKSSNVGTAKIALELPAQTLWDTYTGVGFGQAPRLDFPGAVTGRLRPAKTWRPIEQATISYGHGVSVTLVQLARAYSVFANDGCLVPLTLLKTDTTAMPVRAMSSETALSDAQDARNGGRSRRHRAGRAHSRVPSRGQDRHRVQDQEWTIREGVCRLLRRLCAGVRSAHRCCGNDRRAGGRALRRASRCAGVCGNHRKCIAHTTGDARRAARPGPRNDRVAERAVSDASACSDRRTRLAEAGRTVGVRGPARFAS